MVASSRTIRQRNPLSYFTKTFFNDLLERAIRSFAGAYVTAGAISKDVFAYDSLKFAAGAALASVVLAVATKNVGSDRDSASVL